MAVYNNVFSPAGGDAAVSASKDLVRQYVELPAQELAASTKALDILVDLGKVKFMNSSGLGILIGGMTTMKNADGELVICQADKKIESLLMVTQLIKVFNHFRTLDEAVDYFHQKADK